MLTSRTYEAQIAADAALAQPRFTIAEVSNATGIPRDTIRTWFKRGILSVDEDHIGQAPDVVGFGRMLSGYAAMVIAIMGRLTIGGLSVSRAKRAAQKFVFSGDDHRSPCMLFPDGETVLLVVKDLGRSNGPDSMVRNFGGATGESDWRKIFFLRGTEQIEVLLLDEIWLSTLQKLGLRELVEKAG